MLLLVSHCNTYIVYFSLCNKQNLQVKITALTPTNSNQQKQSLNRKTTLQQMETMVYAQEHFMTIKQVGTLIIPFIIYEQFNIPLSWHGGNLNNVIYQ